MHLHLTREQKKSTTILYSSLALPYHFIYRQNSNQILISSMEITYENHKKLSQIIKGIFSSEKLFQQITK